MWRRRRCALQCEGKASFFSPPKDEHVKNQRLKFIFTTVSQQDNPKLLLCSLYFTDDCFSNLGVQCRIRKALVLERPPSFLPLNKLAAVRCVPRSLHADGLHNSRGGGGETSLRRCEHYDLVVPPVHTCTETEQQWHKPRTTGVKPGPINKTVISKPRLNRLTEGGVRSTLYKGLVGDPLDISLLLMEDMYTDGGQPECLLPPRRKSPRRK
ncbi:unnamed protein product [Leuciscus chuanchicus]